MREVTTGLALKTPPIHVKAGAHRRDRRVHPAIRRPGQRPASRRSITRWPTRRSASPTASRRSHLKDLSIVGPQRVTGVCDTASRRQDLHVPSDLARPKRRACATRDRQARSRRRRSGGPVADRDLQRLMTLLRRTAARNAISNTGVAAALEAILASPQFVFRFEECAGARREVPASVSVLSDTELASRLSFFLWGAATRRRAAEGRRSRPGSARQACSAKLRRSACWPIRGRRRSSTRFASQWLRLERRRGDAARRGSRIRTTTTRWASAASARRAVLRQRGARGSQRARSADRGLHVRQRARSRGTTASRT